MSQERMLTVSVVHFRVPEHNHIRWAIHLKSRGKDTETLYDLHQTPFGHSLRRRSIELANRPRYLVRVRVAKTFAEVDFAHVEKVLEKVEIQRHIRGWNSQDWVLRALRDLRNKELIPFIDHDAAVDELMVIRRNCQQSAIPKLLLYAFVAGVIIGRTLSFHYRENITYGP